MAIAGHVRFILSLCGNSKIDDLTMWRLYGDDSKGVCLVYEVGDIPQGFILKKVCYDTKILRTLRVIIDGIQGRSYVGNNDTWKHFFKPKEYEVEEEYRLLYDISIGNSSMTKKWIHNTAYNIIHPIILFNGMGATNNFPLVLKEIILGPNMPERDTNYRQIKKWISSKGLNVEVKISDNANYRVTKD